MDTLDAFAVARGSRFYGLVAPLASRGNVRLISFVVF